ncbi:MAG: hypothetical protein A2341_26005 [Deltaproteobacteria bacterium RIFOXYB12_FULL_58_9]|nr:MAG: hypothetical protein A2341_26005 [Deltaproteobacteria bacterium RIFOXYB12_FULL_58_9]
MATKRVTIDRFGRLVVPLAVRRRHAWAPGTELELFDDDKGIRLVPAESTPSGQGLINKGGRLIADVVWDGRPLNRTEIRDLGRQVESEREERVWRG